MCPRFFLRREGQLDANLVAEVMYFSAFEGCRIVRDEGARFWFVTQPSLGEALDEISRAFALHFQEAIDLHDVDHTKSGRQVDEDDEFQLHLLVWHQPL